MTGGFVSLVGAGPGDPGLLTLRGLRALQSADVVLYDRLASPALLACVEVEGQERIHVGKTAGPGCSAQQDINRLIVRRAKDGQRVVRLKGGTPLILGRGAEEADACAEAGIPFEIIPGVSAVSAVPAYAGIPVTHRDDASTLHVATGHEREDLEGEGRVQWEALARAGGTVVVLMGILQLERWTAGLMRGGLEPETPAALVRWGTTPRQESLVATLGTLAEEAQKRNFRAPAVAIVGSVVEHRQRLSWFDQRPLHGKVIGVTRQTTRDLGEFSRLERAGAVLVHVPLVQQSPRRDGLLEGEIKGGECTDLVFTSANGVRSFRGALLEAGLDARWLAGRSLWSVGPATSRALRDLLATVPDHVPEQASAQGLVEHARGVGVKGRRFLFPAAAAAYATLRDGLLEQGAEVVQIAAYETVDAPGAAMRLESAFEQGLSMLALASPSAVTALTRALDTLGRDRASLPVAVIGPTTAASAREAGLNVAVMAKRPSMKGVSEAIVDHWLSDDVDGGVEVEG